MYDSRSYAGAAGARGNDGGGARNVDSSAATLVERAEASERLLACLHSCAASQSNALDGGGGSAPGNLHSVVEQRRTELAIAGELGKALLDKSARLSEQSERIRERYASEAEALQTENGKLRRRLAQVEEELRASRKEHDAATADMRRRLSQLTEATTLARQESLRSSELLQQQNERLSAELQAIGQKEPRLRKEESALRRDAAQLRREADEQRQKLDELSEQNLLLRAKQSSLEASCRQAADDTNDVDAACKQLQQKAAWLERKNVSMSEQVAMAVRQLADLQEHLSVLEAELEIGASSDPDVFSSDVRGQSLLEELEISQRSITSGYESTQSADDDFDRLDCGYSPHLPAMPLDAYGQLQVDVHDSIETLKQAASNMAAFLDGIEIADEGETDVLTSDGLQAQSASIAPPSLGTRLISFACRAKRYARDLVADSLGDRDAADLGATDGDELEQRLLVERLGDLRAECGSLAEATAREQERSAQLRRERDDATAASDETLGELLRVKGELMGRENELLETTQARLRLARLQDQWMADMAEVVRTRIESQLQSETARPRPSPAKKTGRRLFR